MKKFKDNLVIIFIILIILTLFVIKFTHNINEVSYEHNGTMTYNKDLNQIDVNSNSIKILQLTDLHLYAGLHMTFTFEIIEKLVSSEKPDLIVITGDIVVSGSNKKDVDKLFKFMEQLQIPWAPVFGNHDDEGEYSLDELSIKYESAKYSLFKKGNVIDRHGNYYYNLVFDDENMFQLIFMDSAEYGFSEDSKRFYEETILKSKEINNGVALNNFLFCHIPLKEMTTAVELYKTEKLIGVGEVREKVCIQEEDVEFFNLMKKYNTTKAMIFGHDHINNAKIMYEGIELCYGMKSSTASYNDEDFVGGTVYIINSDGTYGYRDIILY